MFNLIKQRGESCLLGESPRAAKKPSRFLTPTKTKLVFAPLFLN